MSHIQISTTENLVIIDNENFIVSSKKMFILEEDKINNIVLIKSVYTDRIIASGKPNDWKVTDYDSVTSEQGFENTGDLITAISTLLMA